MVERRGESVVKYQPSVEWIDRLWNDRDGTPQVAGCREYMDVCRSLAYNLFTDSRLPVTGTLDLINTTVTLRYVVCSLSAPIN